MKRIIRIILLVVLVPVLYVAGVIVWAWATDYQPQPVEGLAIQGIPPRGNHAFPLAQDTFVFTTWNIGYGALGAEADFFFDGGKMVHSSKENVEKYMAGILGEIAGNDAGKTDFVMIQEVDTVGDRSYDINEYAAISKALPGYSHIFGKNYDVDFVPMPFTNPYGGMIAGVATWSKHIPSNAARFAFEGQDAPNFPNYLFFLDRCYAMMRFDLGNGKYLCVVNTHNSAYGDAAQKKRQMEQLGATVRAEYAKGNYIVVGGDWNQCPAGYKGIGKFTQRESDETWTELNTPDNFPDAGWKWAYDPAVASNRTLVAPFDADTTYRRILDFFLVSPNVEVMATTGRDLQFAYSDHQPVRMKVRLKGLSPMPLAPVQK